MQEEQKQTQQNIAQTQNTEQVIEQIKIEQPQKRKPGRPPGSKNKKNDYLEQVMQQNKILIQEKNQIEDMKKKEIKEMYTDLPQYVQQYQQQVYYQDYGDQIQKLQKQFEDLQMQVKETKKKQKRKLRDEFQTKISSLEEQLQNKTKLDEVKQDIQKVQQQQISIAEMYKKSQQKAKQNDIFDILRKKPSLG